MRERERESELIFFPLLFFALCFQSRVPAAHSHTSGAMVREKERKKSVGRMHARSCVAASARE